jgi:hypothetical protein
VLRPSTAPSLLGLAAIPSVTEVSRAALLTGRLGRGGSAAEKRGFADLQALRRACGRRRLPQLLHKADIAPGTGMLAASARDAIGATDAPIVGIVHNAIDDQLSGSSQLDRPWSLPELLGLPVVLHEARLAGRLVIITADHGHVLDAGTSSAGEGEGTRWRRPSAPPGTGEIGLAGPRILVGDGMKEIIALWSERLRYGSRHAGYHGGCSPQEMLVPITLLCPRGVKAPPNWAQSKRSKPLWW